MLDRRKKMMRTMTRLIILLPVRPRTLLTQKASSLPMRSRPRTAKMLLLRRRNMCVNVAPIPLSKRKNVVPIPTSRPYIFYFPLLTFLAVFMLAQDEL